jgi:hypothetical protein
VPIEAGGMAFLPRASKRMGLYTKYVLPSLIDLAMRNKDTTRLRAEWIPRARGDVLEIGIGSGRNLPFYSSLSRTSMASIHRLSCSR